MTPYFAPAWAYGGPPRFIYELCRELANRGNSVTVLTTDAGDAASRTRPPEEVFNGIHVLRLPNVSNYLAWNQHLFLPTGTSNFLRDNLRDFDLVHVHLFRTVQNVVVHKITKERGIPYIISGHGTVPRIVRLKATKLLFDILAGHRILRDAGQLVAASEAEKRQYESSGVPESKISVVYNGIDPLPYERPPTRGGFAQKYGFEGKKLVAYVGRINVRKGLEHLLKAFAQLSASRRDLELILVGPDDGYRASLENLARRLSIADRVLFTGLITMPDKLQVLVDSDVVVYPGAYEIFGLVPFEALLCGKPVVVANDSGCGELVEKARAGFTVPVGDVFALKDAIAKVLDHGTEICAMVERGRRFVLESLSWDRLAKEMESVYALVASSSE